VEQVAPPAPKMAPEVAPVESDAKSQPPPTSGTPEAPVEQPAPAAPPKASPEEVPAESDAKTQPPPTSGTLEAPVEQVAPPAPKMAPEVVPVESDAKSQPPPTAGTPEAPVEQLTPSALPKASIEEASARSDAKTVPPPTSGKPEDSTVVMTEKAVIEEAPLAALETSMEVTQKLRRGNSISEVLFGAVDSNNDGVITPGEFKEALDSGVVVMNRDQPGTPLKVLDDQLAQQIGNTVKESMDETLTKVMKDFRSELRSELEVRDTKREELSANVAKLSESVANLQAKIS